MPLVTNGERFSPGIVFLLTGMPTASSARSASLPVTSPAAVRVNEQQVVVRAAGDQAQAAALHAAPEGLCVGENGIGVGGKVGRERLAKGHGLAGDHMLERATLAAGEHRGVDPLGEIGGRCRE